MAADLRFYNLMVKQPLDESAETILARVHFTTNLDFVGRSDFIIENITESISVKKQLYVTIFPLLKPSTIVLVNTSSISISKVSSWLRSNKVIGVHFMNPVIYKPSVEVIIAPETTSKDTQNRVIALLTSLDKTGIIVNDYPGFVSNRISHVFMNEAIKTLQDGVAEPDQIDQIFVQCFAHKMGPLHTADLIGLDTVLNTLNILYSSFDHASEFKPADLLKEKVENNQLGRKSGQGFFTY